MSINKKRQHEDLDNNSEGSDSEDEKSSKKKLKPLIQVSTISNENKNKKLTDILTDLSVFEKNKGQIHKYTAYRKAVLSIKGYKNEIKSGLEAQKLDGVGKKIAKKIDEILQTGSLKKLKLQNQDETLTAINQLSKVSGIGPQKAKSLVEEGIKTIQDLNKIKNTLNHHQQIGLKYFNDFEQRVPRREIEVFEKLVCDSLFNIDPDIISQVCGSYRRGLESSGDVDILISHPKFTLQMKDKKKTFNIIEKLVDSLKKKNILIDDLSLGPLKYMGVCRLPNNIKIDNNINDNSKIINKKNKQDDESDCDTTLDENGNISDESNSEDFSTDSSATEPEDNSKVVKKRIKKVEKKKKLSPKTTTTTTASKLSSNKTTLATESPNNETHVARRIDFKLIPYESYYFGLLHNTGSDEFNRQMRGIALKQGYTLSEYSINKISNGVKNEKPILVDSEKKIFDIIGMEYYPPNKRNL